MEKILAILLALSILCSLPITTALAADVEMEEAEYELYPIPQNISYGTGNSNLPTAVNAYFGTGIARFPSLHIFHACSRKEPL